jgi:hypothetical protein
VHVSLLRMKIPRGSAHAVLCALLLSAYVDAEDYPFPSIEEVPERKLIGVDEHGHPQIGQPDKQQVARLAADSHTPKGVRFYAIWGLAISGYSVESAEGLAKAIEDRGLSSTARGYAAMGLRNFTSQLSDESKDEFRRRLEAIVVAESETVPNGILRTLVAWGDARWIDERLGDRMRGHEMEIEILGALKPEQATGRLLELYRADEMRNERKSYNQRAEIGRALVAFKDKRGIDILETLLDADAVPKVGQAPNHQYRHNVFAAITRGIGQDFGYRHPNYDQSIDESIQRFRSWWLEKRYDFLFEGASPVNAEGGNR